MELRCLLCVVFLSVEPVFGIRKQINSLQNQEFPFLQQRLTKETENEVDSLSKKSKYGVDGDPVFIVAVRGVPMPLCFHIGGRQGDVLRLVQHEQFGLYVNGKIIERNVTRQTYLGSVSLLRHNVRIIASRKGIVVNRHPLSWVNMTAFLLNSHRVIIGQNLLAITFRNKNVTLVIRRHIIPPGEDMRESTADMQSHDPSATMATPNGNFVYLGFYISDSRGLRQDCHGLLGQFIHKTGSINNIQYRNEQLTASLRVVSPGYNRPRISLAVRSDQDHGGTETSTTCWLLEPGGGNVVDGSYIDYLVSDIRNKDVIRFL